MVGSLKQHDKHQFTTLYAAAKMCYNEKKYAQEGSYADQKSNL